MKLVQLSFNRKYYIVDDNSIYTGFEFSSQILLTNEDEYILDECREWKIQKNNSSNYIYINDISKYLKNKNISFWLSPNLEYVNINEINRLITKYKYCYYLTDSGNGIRNINCLSTDKFYEQYKSVKYIKWSNQGVLFAFDIKDNCLDIKRVMQGINICRIAGFDNQSFSVDLYEDENSKMYLQYNSLQTDSQLAVEPISKELLRTIYEIEI